MRKGSTMSFESRAKISETLRRREISRKIFGKDNKTERCFVYCREGSHEHWARIIYQSYYLNGEEIPIGYDIHHKDFDPKNDSIDNLEMLTHGNHRSLHSRGNTNRRGNKVSLETKRKISESLKGKNKGRSYSLETREKSRNSHLGKKASPEARKKMSDSQRARWERGEPNPMKGKSLSLETRKKISEANLGKEISSETRRKISNSNRGKKRSLETGKKISESKIGKSLSEEHKKKIGQASKGRKCSFETRKKMSDSKKGKENLKIRGEKNNSAKLGEKDVIQIKNLLKEKISVNRIANLYEISRYTIYDIKKEKTWKHVQV